MKAPYKIYLRQIPGHRVESFWYHKRGKFCDNHEYIRKDAFLEWLENKVSLSYGVATDTLVEVIDKLNSL